MKVGLITALCITEAKFSRKRGKVVPSGTKSVSRRLLFLRLTMCLEVIIASNISGTLKCFLECRLMYSLSLCTRNIVGLFDLKALNRHV